MDKWVRTDNTITRESARAYWLGRRARHSIQEDGRRLVWDREDRGSENGKDANGSHAFSVIVSSGCWVEVTRMFDAILTIYKFPWLALLARRNEYNQINQLSLHVTCFLSHHVHLGANGI